MSNKTTTTVLLSLTLGILSMSSTGCIGTTAVDLGIFAIPIPVSPYLQKKLEDRAWNHERYEMVPILGPLTAGGPAIALDPPSDDEVMRALERARPVQGGVPLLFETQRNNVRIVKEKIADYVDPPRVYPLVGPAQLHHAHYCCTIYFTERTWVGWPVPHMIENEDTIEVVYIDHNHLHMVGNIDPGACSQY